MQSANSSASGTDCAEISAKERKRQADKLRADVAGANELYLVDARAAFKAAQNGDASARKSSGLEEMTTALGRFASSDKRQVTALREASKRAVQWITEALRAMADRRKKLESKS